MDSVTITVIITDNITWCSVPWGDPKPLKFHFPVLTKACWSQSAKCRRLIPTPCRVTSAGKRSCGGPLCVCRALKHTQEILPSYLQNGLIWTSLHMLTHTHTHLLLYTEAFAQAICFDSEQLSEFVVTKESQREKACRGYWHRWHPAWQNGCHLGLRKCPPGEDGCMVISVSPTWSTHTGAYTHTDSLWAAESTGSTSIRSRELLQQSLSEGQLARVRWL